MKYKRGQKVIIDGEEHEVLCDYGNRIADEYGNIYWYEEIEKAEE